MDEESLLAQLGPPSASWDEIPGRKLSFRRRDCLLTVTLYPDVETRVFRTLTYEVSSDEHNTGNTSPCETRFGITPDSNLDVANGKSPD
ncbi:hypothetical protein [Radicibacter daui]|uniref:hypothetical protein n=1 Tax=Radicibacter daui TaxID=3064829 RepID=UPI004046B104